MKPNNPNLLVMGDVVIEYYYPNKPMRLGASGNCAAHLQYWFNNVKYVLPESVIKVTDEYAELPVVHANFATRLGFNTNVQLISYRDSLVQAPSIRIFADQYLRIDSRKVHCPLDIQLGKWFEKEPDIYDIQTYHQIAGLLNAIPKPIVYIEQHFSCSYATKMLRTLLHKMKLKTLYVDMRHPIVLTDFAELYRDVPNVYIKITDSHLSGLSVKQFADLTTAGHILYTMGKHGGICIQRQPNLLAVLEIIQGCNHIGDAIASIGKALPESIIRWESIPAEDVSSLDAGVSSLGCGDSFFCTFCAAMESSKSLEEAIYLGSIAGAISISHPLVYVPLPSEILRLTTQSLTLKDGSLKLTT
jgi:hypothetical protein